MATSAYTTQLLDILSSLGTDLSLSQLDSSMVQQALAGKSTGTGLGEVDQGDSKGAENFAPSLLETLMGKGATYDEAMIQQGQKNEEVLGNFGTALLGAGTSALAGPLGPIALSNLMSRATTGKSTVANLMDLLRGKTSEENSIASLTDYYGGSTYDMSPSQQNSFGLTEGDLGKSDLSSLNSSLLSSVSSDSAYLASLTPEERAAVLSAQTGGSASPSSYSLSDIADMVAQSTADASSLMGGEQNSTSFSSSDLTGDATSSSTSDDE